MRICLVGLINKQPSECEHGRQVWPSSTQPHHQRTDDHQDISNCEMLKGNNDQLNKQMQSLSIMFSLSEFNIQLLAPRFLCSGGLYSQLFKPNGSLGKQFLCVKCALLCILKQQSQQDYYSRSLSSPHLMLLSIAYTQVSKYRRNVIESEHVGMQSARKELQKVQFSNQDCSSVSRLELTVCVCVANLSGHSHHRNE